MSGPREATAILIAIGDELLRGETVDTNAAFLASRLQARGVRVRRKLTLPDELDALVPELQLARLQYGWVISTGGIGPTPDDLTRQAVALALGAPLEPNAEAVEEYRRRGVEQLNAGQAEMCRLPRGSALIRLPEGGAPGFYLGNLYVLPGVPEVLRAMWPGIEAHFSGPLEHRANFTVTQRESQYSALMEEFVQRYPELKFGSYPRRRGESWEAELRVRGYDAEAVEAAAAELRAAIEASA